MYMYAKGMDYVPASTILRLNFGIFPTVWYFLPFISLSELWYLWCCI